MAFWQHDERIEEGTALRDLEKKVHYLMHVLANAGIAIDWRNAQFTSPDDLPNNDVWLDGTEVQADCRPE